MFDPCNNSIVDHSYRSLKNYKFIPSEKSKNTLYVFCSSNGLYDNTMTAFTETILTDDRYEFCNNYWLMNLDGDKLFLRDIHKQWYVKGLNSTIDTLPKINKLVQGFASRYKKVIFIGSSAGAYLALYLTSQNTDAVSVVSSPFFSLDYVGENNTFVHSICKKNLPSIQKTDIINRSIIIIPSLSAVDVNALCFARREKLPFISIRSKKHGMPISKYSFLKIIIHIRFFMSFQKLVSINLSTYLFEFLFVSKRILIKEALSRWR